ncbi:MAG: hypothetical protein CVV18_02050 [Gammaproteobacteria bacterium HGW-Gammaproteobacteria-8]|nr:MAG: hypothetical protein CVV18_02050 [Gammaproteobacteria bacterium HGW-Gammaproteobacteria-8]
MRDDDRIHDEFNPGASKDQRERAEGLLQEKGSALAQFFEKRNLSEDFRRCELRGKPLERPVHVLLALHPSKGQRHHIVLSEVNLPEIRFAEISYRTPLGAETLLGSIEASLPGRRTEDHRGDKLISVTHFLPA